MTKAQHPVRFEPTTSRVMGMCSTAGWASTAAQTEIDPPPQKKKGLALYHRWEC